MKHRTSCLPLWCREPWRGPGVWGLQREAKIFSGRFFIAQTILLALMPTAINWRALKLLKIEVGGRGSNPHSTNWKPFVLALRPTKKKWRSTEESNPGRLLPTACFPNRCTDHRAARSSEGDGLSRNWWVRLVSNQRPTPYQDGALPLSYTPISNHGGNGRPRTDNRLLAKQLLSQIELHPQIILGSRGKIRTCDLKLMRLTGTTRLPHSANTWWRRVGLNH
jgi:hypothetical protein